jgi:hypothetical protein
LGVARHPQLSGFPDHPDYSFSCRFLDSRELWHPWNSGFLDPQIPGFRDPFQNCQIPTPKLPFSGPPNSGFSWPLPKLPNSDPKVAKFRPQNWQNPTLGNHQFSSVFTVFRQFPGFPFWTITKLNFNFFMKKHDPG